MCMYKHLHICVSGWVGRVVVSHGSGIVGILVRA